MRQYPLTCGNVKCQTSQTPLWRKGWVAPDGRTIMLCNACGLHYKKGHSCTYCNQIYRESDADDNSNPWIGCDRCSRWTHQKCEEKAGFECKSGSPYMCPECRALQNNDQSSKSPDTAKNNGNLKKRRRKPILPVNTSASNSKGSAKSSTKSSSSASTPISPNTPPSALYMFSNFFNSLPFNNTDANWSNVMSCDEEYLAGSVTLDALIGANGQFGYNIPNLSNNNRAEASAQPSGAKSRYSGKRRANSRANGISDNQSTRNSLSTSKKRGSASGKSPEKKRRSNNSYNSLQQRRNRNNRSENGVDSYEVSKIFDHPSDFRYSDNDSRLVSRFLQDQTDDTSDDKENSITLPKKKRSTRAYKIWSSEDEATQSREASEETEESEEEIIILEGKHFTYPKVNVSKNEASNIIREKCFGLAHVKSLSPLASLWAICALERKSLKSAVQGQGIK